MIAAGSQPSELTAEDLDERSSIFVSFWTAQEEAVGV
jgi:hypothetical protein